MAYKLKLEVYDNTGSLVNSSVVSSDLENGTVKQFKSILNPDTYTNIKSDEFYVGGVLDVNDDDVISSHFIKYRIYLN